MAASLVTARSFDLFAFVLHCSPLCYPVTSVIPSQHACSSWLNTCPSPNSQTVSPPFFSIPFLWTVANEGLAVCCKFVLVLGLKGSPYLSDSIALSVRNARSSLNSHFYKVWSFRTKWSPVFQYNSSVTCFYHFLGYSLFFHSVCCPVFFYLFLFNLSKAALYSAFVSPTAGQHRVFVQLWKRRPSWILVRGLQGAAQSVVRDEQWAQWEG